MKNYLRRIAITLFALSTGFYVQGQQGQFSTTPTLGVTTPLLDNGIGFHLGINPAYALSDHISLEGQVSYLYTRITGSFLSGREGNLNAANALVGGRVYLRSPEKRTRIYFNALLGGNYFRDNTANLSPQQEFDLGFSLGGFVTIDRFLVGLSLDTPQNIILKAGFIF